MAEGSSLSLVVIAGAAVLAPLLALALRRWRIPSVLFELGLGIAVGPAVLGWAEVDPFVKGLSTLGLAFLFFVAGYEIDFTRLRGTPLSRGAVGWLVSLALGFGVAVVLQLQGFVISSLLVGLALTTTAIGTLLPMLKDRGFFGTPFGDLLAAAGAIGEFGPVLMLTVLVGSSSPGTELLLLAAFVLLAVAVAAAATRTKPPGFLDYVRVQLSTTSQMPVRVVMFLIIGMVALATQLGLDMLLGAFAAGLIARLALPTAAGAILTPRLDSLGFGFLIPVFFVVSGMNFDITALADPGTAVRVPLFLGLFLAVRGLPALLVYKGVLTLRDRTAMALLQSTALPLLVVITTVGLETDQMRPQNATALVGAGMLSVLVFPLVSFALLGRGQGPPAPGTETDPELERMEGMAEEGL